MLTFPNSSLAVALAMSLEVLEAIYHGKDLDGANGVKHVSMMVRSRCKSTIILLAAEHEFDRLIARQGFLMSEQLQRNQAPVKSIKTEMLGHPVAELGDPRVQALDIFNMGRSGELKLLGELLQLVVCVFLDFRHDGVQRVSDSELREGTLNDPCKAHDDEPREPLPVLRGKAPL